VAEAVRASPILQGGREWEEELEESFGVGRAYWNDPLSEENIGGVSTGTPEAAPREMKADPSPPLTPVSTPIQVPLSSQIPPLEPGTPSFLRGEPAPGGRGEAPREEKRSSGRTERKDYAENRKYARSDGDKAPKKVGGRGSGKPQKGYIMGITESRVVEGNHLYNVIWQMGEDDDRSPR
jgi:hypothetical protein